MEIIKPKDVRIGNFVMYDETIYTYGIEKKIVRIDIDDFKIDREIFSECWDMYRPIEITKEWLLNFGFEQQYLVLPLIQGPINYYIKGNFVYGLADHQVELDQPNKFLCKIKYVHQLQNLFFCLTNEELQLKDEKGFINNLNSEIKSEYID